MQASFLSGPSEDKRPLAYMPLGLRVAKGQVFAGEWMKLGHVGRGGGRADELRTGDKDLHSPPPSICVEILKFLLDFEVAIKIHLS